YSDDIPVAGHLRISECSRRYSYQSDDGIYVSSIATLLAEGYDAGRSKSRYGRMKRWRVRLSWQ
ncbi:hypothetical protein, partial [Enterobacter sp. UPMP2052]